MYFRTVELSDPRFEHEGIRHMTVKSPALSRRGDLSLYIPSQVAIHGCECLLILLNGVYNSHWGWLYHAGVHRTAQRLIETGAIRPIVLAMPSDGLWGDGSAFIAHGAEDAERWVMEDVVQACHLAVPQLRPSPKLFLAGLSMGGFGALRLGAKWALAFSGISAHSAITHISQMSQFVEEPLSAYIDRVESQETLDPLYWMRKNRDTLPPLRMDCGLEDSLLEANRIFHRSLLEEQIEHIYEEFPGGHEWPYWELYIEKTLLFCEEQLKRLFPITNSSGT
jgi:enterochelin esterase-like enzyme